MRELEEGTKKKDRSRDAIAVAMKKLRGGTGGRTQGGRVWMREMRRHSSLSLNCTEQTKKNEEEEEEEE